MTGALQIRIQGTVQGVGFRPFVYRCARQHGLAGWVCNDALGVKVFAQGGSDALNTFAHALENEAPPLSKVNHLDVHPVEMDPDIEGFQILPSTQGESPRVDIARDTTVCRNCLEEMKTEGNRRFGHPFINCTDCGPRYTIIRNLPYDRPYTTMADFEMCPACRKEYEDPTDRRFHAQPVSCPDCGPQLSLADSAGKPADCGNPLTEAVEFLQAGRIVAVKGLGGFHLCCRADVEDPVRLLRDRKGREDRPFALMARDTDTARGFAVISEREQELLESIERPIVVLKALKKNPCVPSVAPGVDTLGIMLPYTPLHILLFTQGGFDALVMTSGNLSGLPLCKDNEEAIEQLKGVADAFLLHDRPIQMRLDDSIARVLGDEPVLLRRARGYVPAPLPAPFDVSGLAALGGIMKSTVCVGRGQTAYVSQYLGTLENTETLDHMDFVLGHLSEVLGLEPSSYVMDRHPGGFQNYLLPEEHRDKTLRIQHHHAHAAACLAENEIDEPTLCFVFDGLGLGEDGTLWGGEILMSDLCESRRLGHLEPLDLPGGDAATEYPGRIAYTALADVVPEEDLNRVFFWMPSYERARVRNMANQPRTSSMGRLFDALSALLDICRRQTYEGQAAIELEAVADPDELGRYAIDPMRTENAWILPGKALLEAAFYDLTAGVAKGTIGARFHRTLACWTAFVAEWQRVKQVGLSGGCFQNALLFEWTCSELLKRGIQPLVHRRLSPGDESVSYGQLITAGARRAALVDKEMTTCA